MHLLQVIQSTKIYRNATSRVKRVAGRCTKASRVARYKSSIASNVSTSTRISVSDFAREYLPRYLRPIKIQRHTIARSQRSEIGAPASNGKFCRATHFCYLYIRFVYTQRRLSVDDAAAGSSVWSCVSICLRVCLRADRRWCVRARGLVPRIGDRRGPTRGWTRTHARVHRNRRMVRTYFRKIQCGRSAIKFDGCDLEHTSGRFVLPSRFRSLNEKPENSRNAISSERDVCAGMCVREFAKLERHCECYLL